MRTHFGQPTDGAKELTGMRAFGIKQFRRAIGGGDQFNLVVVKNIDQPGKAPRLRGHADRHFWDAR